MTDDPKMTAIFYDAYFVETHASFAAVALFQCLENIFVVTSATIPVELFENCDKIRLDCIVLFTVPLPHNVTPIRGNIASEAQHSNFAIEGA